MAATVPIAAIPAANDLAAQMLESLPPYEARSKDFQAVVNVVANELRRVEAARDTVRAQATPQTADALLGAWEFVLGIPVAPAGKTIAQRRNTVIGYVQRIKSIATGPEWVAALTRLIGSQWTYEEYIPPFARLTNRVTNPSAEVNTTGWTDTTSGGGTTTLASAAVASQSGTHALSMTKVALGNMQATTTLFSGGLPDGVAEGDPVLASAYFKSAAVSRSCRVGINFYNASNALIGTTRFSTFIDTTTTSWTRATTDSRGLTIPVGCRRIDLLLDVPATPSGEVHYADAVMCVLAKSGTTASPAYFDGSFAGYEWAGTAHNSASRRQSTVPANTIRVTLPYAPAISAPTGGAATPATTGGVLAAGTWHYKLTAYNVFGETTASADFTGVTTGSTGRNALAWSAVVGASGYRVYRGTTSANQTLIADVATNSYNDVGGQAASSTTPPLVNTTQGADPQQARDLARDITPAHIDLQFVYASGWILGVSKLGLEVL